MNGPQRGGEIGAAASGPAYDQLPQRSAKFARARAAAQKWGSAAAEGLSAIWMPNWHFACERLIELRGLT